jgi:beta-glucosidase-like glycosyl hydrolase
MNPLRFMVPRFNGDRIDEDFDYYLRLVKKGVSGFIVFGGELDTLRDCIGRLQQESAAPLIISSDLEQGFGQQVRGGTLFPPAMAVAEAEKKKPGILRRVYEQVAAEAAYAGINVIFAPVLDINTNPENPIIATRAFGEDPETVSRLGAETIKIYEERDIVPCGKHFPGHGDTAIDSHIGLPVIKKPLSDLEACELVPFRRAIEAGVRMIMLGHLSVPAMDESGIPVSLSKRAVEYLRAKMGFDGIIVTDALNMGGLGGYSPEEAALAALRAGVDVLLHPLKPESLAEALENAGPPPSVERLMAFRKALHRFPSENRPSFDPGLAGEVTKASIKMDGPLNIGKNPIVVVLDDRGNEKEETAFIDSLKKRFPSIRCIRLKPGEPTPKEDDMIVAVFSSVRAWKGGTAPWIVEALKGLEGKARLYVSFGSPYLIRDLSAAKLYAYWDSEIAQQAAAESILRGTS